MVWRIRRWLAARLLKVSPDELVGDCPFRKVTREFAEASGLPHLRYNSSTRQWAVSYSGYTAYVSLDEEPKGVKHNDCFLLGV